METEFVDQKTVKIFLSNRDMSEFNITYEKMDYRDIDTKKAIMKILKEIQKEGGHDFRSGKLLIEAFPNKGEGCVLYISNIKPENEKIKKRSETPLIFQFNGIDLLCDATKRLFMQYSHLILKSALYLVDGKYSLVISSYYKLDEKLIIFMDEYGATWGCGEIKNAFIKEHGKVLMKSNAVEEIVEYIC